MRISSRQLRRMANEVDEQHHEAMSEFQDVGGELHAPSGRSRRLFIRDLGIGSAAITMGSALVPVSRLMPSAFAQGELTDTDVAAFAQSVELAAVAAYEAAAGRDLLDAATVEVATMFAGHHQDHADAFGAVAGDDARPEPNAKLVEAVTPTLEAVAAAEPSDELTGQILQFAKGVENQAAYTYAAALTLLSDPAYAAATSTILPIEAQHATVISLALGEDAEMWFPTGAFESAALGDGTDPLKGFDPAVFA